MPDGPLESNRPLESFLVALAHDQAIRTAYLRAPEATADEAGMSNDEKGVLTTGKIRLILDFLHDGPRPSPPEIEPGGGGGANEWAQPIASPSGLGTFLTTLAQDPGLRADYVRDPANAVQDARLAPEEEAVLATGELLTILNYLDRGGPRPTTPEIMSGGAGTGQGGSGGHASAG